jgi:hypothetical protein
MSLQAIASYARGGRLSADGSVNQLLQNRLITVVSDTSLLGPVF